MVVGLKIFLKCITSYYSNYQTHLLFNLSFTTFLSQNIPFQPYIIVNLSVSTCGVYPPHNMCKASAPHLQNISTTANDGKHAQI